MRVFLLLFLSVSSAWADDVAWKQLKGDFVVVKYRLEVPVDFAQNVLRHADDDFRRIAQWFKIVQFQDWRNQQRISIEIYRDDQDYMANGGGYVWAHGQALAMQRLIKTFPQEAGFFDTVLPHELSHIIIRYVTGFNADLPLWFDEGIAMYHEQAQRYGADLIVKKAMVKNQVIAIEQMVEVVLGADSSPDQIELFYAQSASIVKYLINEFGQQKFSMLIKLLKESISFQDAVSKIYIRFNTIKQLHQAWINKLGE
jgi:hypothetical protein